MVGRRMLGQDPCGASHCHYTTAQPNADILIKVAIKGGLCNNSEKAPTGQPGCVYMYESLEDKDLLKIANSPQDFLSLDNLVGITAAKCGNSGERTCTDWADWRKNCYETWHVRLEGIKRSDQFGLRQKRFCVIVNEINCAKTDLGDGKMKVDVEETDYCVEYDLHPYCQDAPPDLCNNVDCQSLSPSEKEIGLEYWLGRCEESHNTKRAESINFAFTKTPEKNHLMVDKDDRIFAELLDSNFKCSSGGMRCTPNLDGGLYCTRQYGGVCTPCFIPGTKVPFPAANTTPTCPFNVLAEGGYTPPAGTECKSRDAADICCLYKAWEEFKADLKASTAVNFGPGSGTEAPGLPGDTTTPASPEPGKNKVHHAHYPVWITVAAVGACGFLAAVPESSPKTPARILCGRRNSSFIANDANVTSEGMCHHHLLVSRLPPGSHRLRDHQGAELTVV
eukprot:s241_g26.t1